MASARQKVIRILAFGNSLTEGYRKYGFKYHPYTTRLQELLLSSVKNTNVIFEIVNHGVSGETTKDMTPRLAKILDDGASFDLVIILGGTNDVGTCREDADALFKRIKCLHEKVLKHNSATKTVAVTLPETGYETLSGYEKFMEKRLCVNELLRNFALDKERVVISDLSNKLPRHSLSTEDLDKFWDDGLHFTAQGYNKMAEIIFEDVKHLYLN